jgi:hypothetical protein
LRPLAFVVIATAVVAPPWYIRQAITYGDPIFDRQKPHVPIWERLPASF